MDRIAFLISDLSMQQMVHTILDTYKEKLEQHHFIIDVEIIDFPNLVAQAHALVEKGTKVIITTSGAHQILTKAIDTIPILCLYSSTNDALYALRAIAPNYKKFTCCSMKISCSTGKPVRRNCRRKSYFIPDTASIRLTWNSSNGCGRYRSRPTRPSSAVPSCPKSQIPARCRFIPSSPANRRCCRFCSTPKNCCHSKKRTISSCP